MLAQHVEVLAVTVSQWESLKENGDETASFEFPLRDLAKAVSTLTAEHSALKQTMENLAPAPDISGMQNLSVQLSNLQGQMEKEFSRLAQETE